MKNVAVTMMGLFLVFSAKADPNNWYVGGITSFVDKPDEFCVGSDKAKVRKCFLTGQAKGDELPLNRGDIHYMGGALRYSSLSDKEIKELVEKSKTGRDLLNALEKPELQLGYCQNLESYLEKNKNDRQITYNHTPYFRAMDCAHYLSQAAPPAVGKSKKDNGGQK